MISRTVCEEFEASVVYHQTMLGYTKSPLDLTTSEVWMYIFIVVLHRLAKFPSCNVMWPWNWPRCVRS